jgi:hypothetical protein
MVPVDMRIDLVPFAGKVLIWPDALSRALMMFLSVTNV